MALNDKLLKALKRAGSIRFPINEGNVAAIEKNIDQLKTADIDGISCLHEGDAPSVRNTRIRIYPTGHMVFYSPAGNRFLCADPTGHPLHEAEWIEDEKTRRVKLQRVRMQLDSGEWVGILPKAKTFTSEIDIKGQPGWEEMSLDDLREKAAAAWRVPVSEVKYFYKDENLVHKGEGKYNVILTKDSLYSLKNGFFDQTLFISFMFSLNWERLDLIPVVELFQSTLPGCGGAVFEFIWGLYGDQSRERPLDALRYRGLPTYPSPAAFNIFSAFFIPQGPNGETDKKVLAKLFMQPDRSHEITWTPRDTPPWRYFSDDHGIVVTVQERFLYKVTVVNDSIPTPFINVIRGGRPSCQREVQVGTNSFLLVDGEVSREIPLAPEWKVAPQTDPPRKQPEYPFEWKWFFNGFPPQVDPVKSLYTVPFYPEGKREIEESSLQPMVLDQIFYYMEMSPGMPAKLDKVEKVLIHTFDTVIAGCVDSSKEREVTVLFSDPEFAQKNGLLLWDYAAGKDQLDNLKKVSFLAEKDHVIDAYRQKYGLIFKWIPFMYFQDREACESMLKALSDALLPQGLLFLVAPRPLQGLFHHYSLDCSYNDQVVNMPFFRQHLKMCPENMVNPDLTVFLAEKMDQPKEETPPPQAQKTVTDISEPEPMIRDYSRLN